MTFVCSQAVWHRKDRQSFQPPGNGKIRKRRFHKRSGTWYHARGLIEEGFWDQCWQNDDFHFSNPKTENFVVTKSEAVFSQLCEVVNLQSPYMFKEGALLRKRILLRFILKNRPFHINIHRIIIAEDFRPGHGSRRHRNDFLKYPLACFP